MPKSTAKTILYCRVQVEKKMHFYPVSVHVNDQSAKNYAAMLYMAYQQADATRVKELDPTFPTLPSGDLPTGAKWSIKQVPYEPTFNVADDVFELETPPTT